jgi:hypothetical protein
MAATSHTRSCCSCPDSCNAATSQHRYCSTATAQHSKQDVRQQLVSLAPHDAG